MIRYRGMGRVSALPFYAYTAILAAATVPAAAQETVDTYLSTITVTSTRTEGTIKESPRTTHVVTRAELDKRAPESVAEMLRDVPGIEVVDASVAGMKRLRIRGESSRRVTVLVDGQEITDHSSYGTPILIDPDVIERIDVIRGPSSVLYGTKSIGGVINIITKRGGPNPIGAELSGSYFSATEGYHWSTTVHGTLGAFDYRITAAGADHGDRDVAGTEFDPSGKLVGSGFENDSVSAHLGFRFGSRQNHYLQVKADRFNLDANVWTDPDDLGLQPNGSTIDAFKIDLPERDRKKIAVFYDVDDIGEVLKKVHFDAYYQTIDRVFLNDVGVLPNTGAGPFRPGPTDIDVGIRSDDTITNIGTSLQLDLKPAPNHYLIVGAQYLSDELDKALTTNTTTAGFFPARPPALPFPPFPLAVSTTSGFETDLAETQTISAFVQDEWEVGDRVTFTGGLRHYTVLTDLKESNHSALFSGEDHALLGSVGVTAEVTPTNTARLLFSQGYVYPTLLQLFVQTSAGGTTVNPNPDLKAETSDNVEIGWRHEGSALLIDAAGFITWADDYLLAVSCATTTIACAVNQDVWENISGAKTFGIELLAELAIPDTALTTYVSGAWTKRRLDYPTFSTYNSNTPEWSGRAGIRKDWVWGDNATAYADLYLRGGSGVKLIESDGTFEEEDPWVTLNLALGTTIGTNEKYRISLNLNNLTNESYRPLVDELPGAGRSVELTAKIKLN